MCFPEMTYYIVALLHCDGTFSDSGAPAAFVNFSYLVN